MGALSVSIALQAHAIAVAVDVAQVADMLDQRKAAARRLRPPRAFGDRRDDLLQLGRHRAEAGGRLREIVGSRCDQVLEPAIERAGDPRHHLQRAGALAAFDLARGRRG